VTISSANSARRLRVVGGFALALATTALFFVSRGKWSDAIIDSGREWIVPDALSRGELLYRDVVYWVGPFTPYVHAAWLRVFGSTLPVLTVAGAVDSAALLAALFLALRQLVGRRSAALWTALAIPAVIFMPASGGLLIGMGYRQAATFSLLALTLVSRKPAHGRASVSWVVGALCGLAALCRTEWGIAALGAALLGTWMRHFCGRDLSGALRIVVAAILTFGSVIGVFVLLAGFDPVIREGHLLLTGLPPETKRFMASFSGIGDLRRGIANSLYSAFLWLVAFLLLRLLAVMRNDPQQARRRSRVLLGALIVLAFLAAIGGARGPFLWSGAPGLCLFAVFWSFRRRGRRDSSALASFGAMGLMMSHRRFFHIGDSWYVGNPLVFAFVCAALLLRMALASERRQQTRMAFERLVSISLAVLTVFAFVMRIWQYRDDPRVPIAGTAGLLSATPGLAPSIEEAASAVRGRTRPQDGLVVFPEGELLNYLSGRKNPCRHKMYLPGYLVEENEPEILAELEKAKPAAVAVVRRPTSEYGPALFGDDYGRRIRAWISSHYEPAPLEGGRRAPIHLFFRRSPSLESGAPLASPASSVTPSMEGGPRQ
jgi:hypothetical protein